MNCPKCGKEIANDSNFCEYCGNPVKKSHKKTKWIPLVVIALVVQLTSFIIIIMAMSGTLFGKKTVYAEDLAEIQAEDTLEYEASTELPPVEAPAELAEVVDYVDLGLPSGTLWKTINENGFYDYHTAVRQFSSQLPTEKQLEELKSDCQWTWDGSGYEVTGPNGKSINLPASGDCGDSGICNVGEFGRYWSSTRWDQNDGTPAAMCISFHSEDIYLYNPSCDFRISVRLVRQATSEYIDSTSNTKL